MANPPSLTDLAEYFTLSTEVKSVPAILTISTFHAKYPLEAAGNNMLVSNIPVPLLEYNFP